jgi:predicted transposase YbfD/YdcC
MQTTPAVGIFTHFAKLTDPRINRSKLHLLHDIIVLALCAALCGCDTWVEVEAFGKAKRRWFEKFLELPHGIPSHDTFGRVFAALDTGAFLGCLQSWLASLSLALNGEVIAIDGKTVRASLDRAAGKSPLHLVSAWATKNRLVLGQVATAEDSNEITAIPKLLSMLELLGAVVTLDAMGCQTAIAAQIRDQGGDYVLAVKGNQETTLHLVTEAFERHGEQDYPTPAVRQQHTEEQGHGRQEKRTYYVAAAPPALQALWRDVRSIVMVVRQRIVQGRESGEVSYYLSSLPPQVRRLADAIRRHWGIENGLHWSLDVIFAEDRSRMRMGNAAETAALLRRLVLSILRRDTQVSGSLRVKRLKAGWDETVLLQLLASFSGN